jgi:hypothetical protein
MKVFFALIFDLVLIFSQFNSAGQPSSYPEKTDTFLVSLLKQYPDYFAKIYQNRDSFRVQIIYTQIDRDAQNTPFFKCYYFNVDSTKYFYPASTVKFPVVLLALQKIHELRLPGLDKRSTLITENNYSGQTAVYNDPTTADGKPSIYNYIKKIFLVSDNDAFNRLYEFLGQEYINKELQKRGYADAQIIHRLSLQLTEDENRHTNPVSFYDVFGKTLYKQSMQASHLKYADRRDSVGYAYYDDGDQLVSRPMNFSKKNRISLGDLNNILQSVLFPNSIPAGQRFTLTSEDYQFIYQYMSQYPRETMYPAYDSANYWDAFGKLLYWGSEKVTLPQNLRIFNKEGDAYGFLTDISYFVDFDKKIEFMLSATIYCNSDGVLNDDKYDYETLGLPFMKHLGQIIYDFELKRKRKFNPNLNGFKMKYDK